ncbi:MAG TPA: hypothetical protein VK982_04650 [Bacteroidales bacterium]|nr:hypothetical protein [Bacteroidales bacterium]
MKQVDIVIRQVNEELRRKFKAKVASEGSNMTEKAEELIRKYLKEENK